MAISNNKVPGIVTDNPEIAKQVNEEASIKTPEQAKYADAEAAVRAERIAKNKANAALDAYDSEDRSNGAYGSLLARAQKIQSLSSAGRSTPAATADEVAATQAEAAAATASADKLIAGM